MRDIWTFLQMAFAAIGGWLGWFLGGYDGFLYALIAFVVIDYLLGVMCAILEKHLIQRCRCSGHLQESGDFFSGRGGPYH